MSASDLLAREAQRDLDQATIKEASRKVPDTKSETLNLVRDLGENEKDFNDAAATATCRATTTNNIEGTYDGQKIEANSDGSLPPQGTERVSMRVGDMLKVDAQSDTKQNGIYYVSAVGSTTTK